jgi:uncharacterized phage protein gp47/JayE
MTHEAYGVTTEGYSRKPFAKILEGIQSRTRGYVGAKLALDDKDPVGALAHAAADELDRLEQGIEAGYYSFDVDNAVDFLLFALGSLTGTPRLAARKGTVLCTVNLDASKTFAAGTMVGHVDGDATNRWVNVLEVVSTTAGNYTNVQFESELAGSAAVAPAASLTVIAQRVAGWNSITNPADATAGKDAETAAEFRVRREQFVAQAGNGTAAAVRAAVANLEGVIDVKVYENDTDATVGALPPHSLQVVVWDGELLEASDDSIAQAILDSKPGGITAIGALDGIAIDLNGNEKTIDFDRVTIVPLYCEITVTAPLGASADAIKAAIQAVVPQRGGDSVVFLAAKSAALSVAGVTDVTVFKLDTVDPAVNTSANITSDETEIFDLDSADIDVTIP